MPGLVDRGLDYGIAHTLDDGRHLDRPDTSPLQEQARTLRKLARSQCRKGSRQYGQRMRRATDLTARAARIQDDWECQSAARVVRGAGLVSREDLHLRSMTASARGTVSHSGSGTARGLNRELAHARIGHLDRRTERRCLKCGTDTVKVHPGNHHGPRVFAAPPPRRTPRTARSAPMGP